MPNQIRTRRLAQAALSAVLGLLALPACAQSLSLLDARVVEGNAGDALMVFEARLSAPASNAVRFNMLTLDRSAIAGSDYRSFSVSAITIPAGQTSILVSVPVNGDVEVEANEYFEAAISFASGATIARSVAKGLIVNDDDKMLVTAPADPALAGSAGYATDFSALSYDGRYVAFVSTARDLVAGRPANSVKNVYVRDSRTGVTTLATVAADGGDADGDSTLPSVSYDGRYVVFQSAATNLVANDGNGATDIFRRDLQTGTTTLVSLNAAGTGPSSGFSSKPGISSDARFIAFQSNGDIVAGVDNLGRVQAYLRDMQSGTTALVSRDPYGAPGADTQGGYAPHVNSDGRFVVYDRGGTEPWRRDMQAGTSTSALFSFISSTSYNYGISSDGRYILFDAWADNLDNRCDASASQVFVSDMITRTTRCASLMSTDTQSFSAFYPSMSGDGRFVAFQASGAAVGDPWDGSRRIFVRDLQADTTTVVSSNWQGGNVGGHSEAAAISGNGRVVSFTSSATTMLPGDYNAQPDTFRVELPQDPSLPLLSISDATVLEDNSGAVSMVFTVSLSQPSATGVSFNVSTADGSAQAGSDYLAQNTGKSIPAGQTSTSVTIAVYGDTAVELAETFSAYITNVYGARVADGQGAGVIGNDDYPPVPTLSISDQFIVEGTGGTKPMAFTVSLSNSSATPVSFDIATANGTAIGGSDFVAAAQRLTIPAGSTSLDFIVDVIGDTLLEPGENFTVNLGNPSGATILRGTASGTIANDDAAYPQLSVGNVTVSEGNSGTRLATFTVSLSAASTNAVSFDIATSDGTALAGSDYVAQALSGQVIPAGATTASFSVTVYGDTAVEADETFKATLSNVVNANGNGVQGTATIANDDVSLSIADVTLGEGDSGTKLATFTVQLSAPAPAPVNFTVATANGSASAPTDYVAKSQSLQIAAGTSSASFAVTVNGDTTIEPDESFQVNVGGVSGATVADGQAVGTITNDDFLPALSIGDASILEGNNSTRSVTFLISLSKAATATVSFNIATANGTAVAPGDYTAKSASAQTIPAGTLSKTFTVTIKGDKTIEPNETFFVNLSNVSGPVTLSDGQAVGNIVNDDGATLSVARVTTGGLVDDVEDRRGEPVVSAKEYALLLLDGARQVCARAGGAGIVGIDGIENLAVLADLADTANRTCARQPQYRAALKADGLGFLVDRGTQLLGVSGANARVGAVTVLAEGHARPLTVLLATTPSTNARERAAQAQELNRLVRARLAAEPQARLVVLGAAGIDGLVDLTARSLPTAGGDAERVWVSAAMLEEFDRVQLELPNAAKPDPSKQVLQLQP
jgi:hypothetical protein